MKPLALDLFCGLGGWAEGFLAAGFDVVGFDIERHQYMVPMSLNGHHIGDAVAKYPAQLVLQDVLTLHGSQFRNASAIVASPPCQRYSYMAMPWTRAKKLAAEYRDGTRSIAELNALFDACFRIQREASEAAGHHIPMVVENVKGAQPWVGRARWHFGSFFLWGDVPALMPFAAHRKGIGGTPNAAPAGTGATSWFFGSRADPRDMRRNKDGEFTRMGQKNGGGSWFGVGSPGQKETGVNPVNQRRRTRDLPTMADGYRRCEFCRFEFREDLGRYGCPNCHGEGLETSHEGTKQNGSGPAWFDQGIASHGSRSSARKAASAQIAKIPFPLAEWIARCFLPTEAVC